MKKILSKILEEINKESPRLDYIRGLIEASVEEETMAPMVHSSLPTNVDKVLMSIPILPVMDEASIMESETKAFIAKNGMPNPVVG